MLIVRIVITLRRRKNNIKLKEVLMMYLARETFEKSEYFYTTNLILKTDKSVSYRAFLSSFVVIEKVRYKKHLLIFAYI